MSLYRRYFVPGGTYFFTLVTARRWPLFADDRARRLLGTVMRQCFSSYPLDEISVVLLPDHLHAIWALPPGDSMYSMRWSWIKGNFSRQWLELGGSEQQHESTSVHEGRRNVWQRRFWEHTIRDEEDLEAHCNYIHFNPVKHGYVSRPRDWPWSSFHRFVASGHYNVDWGAGIEPPSVPGEPGRGDRGRAPVLFDVRASPDLRSNIGKILRRVLREQAAATP